jgi:hypothetical protein
MPSAGLDNITANLDLIRTSYKNTVAMGPAVNGAAFRMIIREYPKLEFLIQATQLPELKREMIEATGPFNIKFRQYGEVQSCGQVTISFKEVISGKCYEAIRKIVLEAKPVSITLALLPEENAESVPANTVDLKDCLIEFDAVDLSVEEGASMVKPTGVIHYSWLSWHDVEPTKSIGWSEKQQTVVKEPQIGTTSYGSFSY